jgi:hypothetical protein
MKKSLAVLGLSLGACVPGITFASAGWTDFGPISTLEQDPGGGSVSNLVFVVVGVTSNPSGCSTPTGFYLSFDGTGVDAERKKRLFAMLTAAQLAGRNVRIYTTGTCHSVGYAELDGVVVQ